MRAIACASVDGFQSESNMMSLSSMYASVSRDPRCDRQRETLASADLDAPMRLSPAPPLFELRRKTKLACCGARLKLSTMSWRLFCGVDLVKWNEEEEDVIRRQRIRETCGEIRLPVEAFVLVALLVEMRLEDIERL